MLWQIGDNVEHFQSLATQLFSTAIGSYLSLPYSYLAMTRRSQYVSAEEAESRLVIQPTDSKYLFVYPFIKTRPWYALSSEERQELMNHHISTGRKYPSIKLNTTYSFGLDDQEFVVAFEGDDPSEFLDLVMELRSSKVSAYTLVDTPAFTCISMNIRDVMNSLGAFENLDENKNNIDSHGDWVRVANSESIPKGELTVVHLNGEQVALFNDGDSIFAFDNRCSHANGLLSEGEVNSGTITCPWHNSQFDVASGNPIKGPANRPLRSYLVKLKDGEVFLSESDKD